MPGFVDLHAHYLPALDDGAKTLEVGLQMVDGIAALGFSHLFATPHQRPGLYLPELDAVRTAFAGVRAAVAERRPELTLGLGAENFWDALLHDRLKANAVPGYDGGRSFLFEVDPAFLPPRLDHVLYELRLAGWLPVLAHPERYRALQEDPSRAEALGRTAALLVDLGSLDGAYGRGATKLARTLVEEGLAHAAATDVHAPEDLRAVANGIAWIKKRLGAPALARLLEENPRRILAGELP
jgi:protein-tyrosine phosphatase